MSKFKIGDAVVRIRAEHLGMRVGDKGTVEAIYGGSVVLKEFKSSADRGGGSAHDANNLELYKANGAADMILSGDANARKSMPITTGVLDYFPRALAAVAQCSKAGNDQHNPGLPLHWDKTKSADHADCIARHLIDRNTVDTDGVRHAAKLAWRALAMLEIMLEKESKDAD